MAFFEGRENNIHSSNPFEDFLIASDFDRIFEAMVDDLIAQPKDFPSHIKWDEQEDGKRIDHLFKYKSIIDDSSLAYYIVDSKYYTTVKKNPLDNTGRGNKIEGDSLFKQFTYARNLIQERLRNPDKEAQNPRYSVCRDDKTEGYNIIPNFFLSAYIDQEHLQYDDNGIEHRDQDDRVTHFSNRLFDRETLLVSHYDINFLYVIKQYSNNGSKEQLREEIHQIFRNNVLKRLNNEYSFYILELKNKPKQGEEQQALKEALDPIFRLVNGKVFCPKKEPSYTNLILALEKPENHISASSKQLEEENREVIAAFEKDFVTPKEFKLGANIKEIIKKTAE